VIAFIVALREASVMLVTEGGTGKRTPMAEFPVQRRGGLGMRAMPARERGGHLVGALEALDDDKVVLVSAAGAVTGVAAAEIALRHRTAPGHPIVKPGPGDRIVDVTRLYGEAPASGGRDLLSPA